MQVHDRKLLFGRIAMHQAGSSCSSLDLTGSANFMRPTQLHYSRLRDSPLTDFDPSQSAHGDASKAMQTMIRAPKPCLCPYTGYHSKRSDNVRKIYRYYVGLLLQLPPPVVVRERWIEDVRTDLENDLCRAISQLSQSMTGEEVRVEAVLCMAGKKCSTSDVTMPAGIERPKDPVRMIPTVWIHCGSKKCKKKVSQSLYIVHTC
jgi:hypothetical protein